MTGELRFAVGDIVQIIYHSNGKYIGRLGVIISVGSGFKSNSQPIKTKLPKEEVELRYSIEFDNGILLHDLHKDWIIKSLNVKDQRGDRLLNEFGKNLAVQLSGVRKGQRDHGRISNVSGHLLNSAIGDKWDNLNERQQNSFIAEEDQILREIYEEYLRRGFSTLEAAQESIKDELGRLSRRFMI